MMWRLYEEELGDLTGCELGWPLQASFPAR
jgi:hypothetical protein